MNPVMAYGDNRLASAADSAKIYSEGLGWLHLLVGYL